MKKFTLFQLKILNKLFLGRSKGKPSDQEIFDYMMQIVVEGKSFGLAGSIKESGEIHSIHEVNRVFKDESIIVFDVGANKGQYQQALIENLKVKAFEIHSFEPSPSTFKHLNEKTRPNCTNHNVGMGEKSEKLNLFRTGEGSPLSSLHKKQPNDYYQVEMTQSEEVVIETIDEFCTAKAINHIHYLKMDIEGHELFALKGAKSMIEKDAIDLIQFEFGPPNIDSKTYLRDFTNLLDEKYKIFRVLKYGLCEFGRSEKEEIFLPINYLAVRKPLVK